MSDPDSQHDLVRRAQRMAKARGRKQRLLAGLGLVGSLGWIVALPIVGGALLGRYLDQQLGTGLQLTLGLLLLGVAVGGYSAWRFFLRGPP